MCSPLKNQDSLMRAGLCPHALSVGEDDTMTVRFCTASEASLVDSMAPGLSQQSKGKFLFSTTTAGSHVNNPTPDLEDGVVNSPPSQISRGLRVCSPSPLRVKGPAGHLGCELDSKAVGNRSPEGGRTNRKLYISTTLTTEPTNVEVVARVEEGSQGHTARTTFEKHVTHDEPQPLNLLPIQVTASFPCSRAFCYFLLDCVDVY